MYFIESRWPAWARWRRVTARPHGESYPFNAKRELAFPTREQADTAALALSRANAGEYRVADDNADSEGTTCSS